MSTLSRVLKGFMLGYLFKFMTRQRYDIVPTTYTEQYVVVEAFEEKGEEEEEGMDGGMFKAFSSCISPPRLLLFLPLSPGSNANLCQVSGSGISSEMLRKRERERQDGREHFGSD